MKIGAHVSTAGGVDKGIERAAEIGAEAVQIFASSPRGWAFKPIADDKAQAFREKSEQLDIGPAFIHGSYLVNLGGTPDLAEKSITCLVQNMNAASQLGVKGVIFHCGSHKGVGFDAVLGQAAKAAQEVLAQSPSDVWLILENSAGMGAHIGASFTEIGRLISAIGSPQVKVCLDTEHAFAAGYDIANPAAIDAAMDEFDREIGLHRFAAVHANDAKVEFGSGVDRHENIGEGHIGVQGFETILSHAAFRDVPFLLEVPGFDKKGPDLENVNRLKQIRERLMIPA